MRNSFFIATVFSLLIVAFGFGCGPITPASNTTAPVGATIITISTNAAGLGTSAYGPALHVPVGTTISWYNSDSMIHTATTYSAPATFDTGAISPQTYSTVVAIVTPGTYNYDCTIHGQASMSGQIISP